MRVLLVGPYPPPHGGISVHVSELRRQLCLAGIECHLLNVDPKAPPSGEYIFIRGGLGLFATVAAYARRGWTIHVHTNGHNHKSWLVALTAGLAGIPGPGSVLTLHSGMVPGYLAAGRAQRALARVTSRFYRRMIAVSTALCDSLLSLGVPPRRVETVPAFFPPRAAQGDNPEFLALQGRRPVLATTLFFRPEYGFDILVDALDRLRERHPQLVCLAMGDGEGQAEAKRLVAAHGLKQSVVFLGNVPHDKCVSLISQSDLFVRPALVDGDANSVREALATGVPVVASDIAVRPEGAVLFRCGDAADLAAKIEVALQQPRPAASTANPSAGQFAKLLDIYESIQGEGTDGETRAFA